MDDTRLGMVILGGLVLVVIASGGSVLKPQNQLVNNSQRIDTNSGQYITGVDNYGNPVSIDKNASPYKGKVYIQSINPSSDYGDSYAAEYIQIGASSNNKEKIAVTGWTLRSLSTGISARIGTGVYLPYPNKNNFPSQILLSPGDRALVSTIGSPIGMSFKLNVCTGYFAEDHRFLPSIETFCPVPRTDNITIPAIMNDSNVCISYIRGRSRCTILPREEDLPDSLTSECRAFIKNKFTYDSCVIENISNPDFYKPEWRIYLGRYGAQWRRDREEIQLLDQNGKVVDSKKF